MNKVYFLLFFASHLCHGQFRSLDQIKEAPSDTFHWWKFLLTDGLPYVIGFILLFNVVKWFNKKS